MKIIFENKEYDVDNKTSLEEASTSRLVQRFTDKDSTFAIISASRPDKDNKARLKSLKSDVRSLGLGFNEFVGRRVENGESFDEDSLLIPDISFEDAFKLGQKYDQSSIIYKDSEGVREICTTPFESYSVGDVVRDYNIDPNKPLNTSTTQKIFSSGVDETTSFLKKDSNRKPFNFQIKENFELYEKQFLNTRLGFTKTKINLSEDE